MAIEVKHRYVQYEGVLWYIAYEDGDDGMPLMVEVRVTDSQRRPVGPNVIYFLTGCYFINDPESTEACAVLGELNEQLEARLH
jgi:hypothetical protein